MDTGTASAGPTASRSIASPNVSRPLISPAATPSTHRKSSYRARTASWSHATVSSRIGEGRRRTGLELALELQPRHEWLRRRRALHQQGGHHGPLNAYVAVYENALNSQVRAGENSGATLHHERVVRQWIGPVPLAAGNAQIRRDHPHRRCRLPTRRPASSAWSPSSKTPRPARYCKWPNWPPADIDARDDVATDALPDSSEILMATPHAFTDTAPSRRADSAPARFTRSGCASRTGSTRWRRSLMMLSGWRIYDASPIFKGFMFPPAHHAGRLARRRVAMALRGDVAAVLQRPRCISR